MKVMKVTWKKITYSGNNPWTEQINVEIIDVQPEIVAIRISKRKSRKRDERK